MDKKKRKPQKTTFFTDKESNRLYKAVDMGWADTHWARLKSQAIIDAMRNIVPFAWKVVTIDHDDESKFTKAIERAWKALDARPKYLVIRTKSPSDDTVDSWFIINSPRAQPITWDELSQATLITSARELAMLLEKLFNIEMHPDPVHGKKLKRFSISRSFSPALIVARLEVLIPMARHPEDHRLVDGTKRITKFEPRLARYIKADNPLIYHVKLRNIFLALLVCRDKKQIITKDEVIKVIQLLVEKHGWRQEGVYIGLPKHGTERDKKEGGFYSLDGKHGAVSYVIDSKTRSAWNLDEMPKAESGEEYIDE